MRFCRASSAMPAAFESSLAFGKRVRLGAPLGTAGGRQRALELGRLPGLVLALAPTASLACTRLRRTAAGAGRRGWQLEVGSFERRLRLRRDLSVRLRRGRAACDGWRLDG